ncbi:amidohydrolase family protein [Pseudonocardia eucalypti]|uniref:Amidohydrolase family protein n=1 Tax=Pseudonocardia eucalypti TaxID=648755 RepID=A0ABP9Q804_9PSEU|nr:putative TIM-barrel fold metal-dependent hydrolase [Pseudonocardia eucalypti]
MTEAAALPEPPVDDADVPRWWAGLGLDGLVDLHVHFLPESVQRKVWAYFDRGAEHYGRPWPITYRTDEPTRVETLRELGVSRFAPLVYPHKPDMAAWLNGWVAEFAARTPDAVPTATMYPEPGVADYLGKALADGARCVKVHVQVGGFDPRDPELDQAWGLIAEAGVPAVVHCGHGPRSGAFTGLDLFGEVLAAHPRLTAVLAHAGMPDYGEALDLVGRYGRVYIDTTMVGVAYTEGRNPLPPDWTDRLAGLADRVVLGTDFPSIPYQYSEQLRAIHGWAAADARLGRDFLRAVLHDTPARLLG